MKWYYGRDIRRRKIRLVLEFQKVSLFFHAWTRLKAPWSRACVQFMWQINVMRSIAALATKKEIYKYVLYLMKKYFRVGWDLFYLFLFLSYKPDHKSKGNQASWGQRGRANFNTNIFRDDLLNPSQIFWNLKFWKFFFLEAFYHQNF